VSFRMRPDLITNVNSQDLTCHPVVCHTMGDIGFQLGGIYQWHDNPETHS